MRVIREGQIAPAVRPYAWLPWAWLLLAFASTFSFTMRGVEEAALGNPSAENIGELAIYALVGLLCLKLIASRRSRALGSPGLSGLLLFSALGMVSALWSSIPLFTTARGLQLGVVALLALVSTWLWRDGTRDIAWDLSRVALGILAISGLLSVVGLSTFSIDGRFGWADWTHPADVAGILGIGVTLCWWLPLANASILARPALRRALLIGSCILIIFVFLTRSRAGLVASLVSWTSFLLLSPVRSNRNRAALAGIAVFTVAALLVFEDPASDYILRDQPLDELFSLTGRVPLWEAGVQTIGQSPVFGHGLGSSRLILTATFPWAGTGHNMWVEAGIGMGLVGAALATFLLGWLLLMGWRLRRDSGHLTPLIVSTSLMAIAMSVAETTIALPGFWFTWISLVTAVVATVVPATPRRNLRSAQHVDSVSTTSSFDGL